MKGWAYVLVPAWDFTLDGWLHDRMAVMRGVESGFTVVRAAKQALLTVSHDRGRILAQQDAVTVRFASLLATAPVRHDNTFYARWGDGFAWLNIAGLVALLLSPRKQELRGPVNFAFLPLQSLGNSQTCHLHGIKASLGHELSATNSHHHQRIR
jgi:hypothetical protein